MRWFELTAHRLACWDLSSKQTGAVLKDGFELCEVAAVRAHPTEGRCVELDLHCARRLVQLKAESEAARDEWVQALHCALSNISHAPPHIEQVGRGAGDMCGSESTTGASGGECVASTLDDDDDDEYGGSGASASDEHDGCPGADAPTGLRAEQRTHISPQRALARRTMSFRIDATRQGKANAALPLTKLESVEARVQRARSASHVQRVPIPIDNVLAV